MERVQSRAARVWSSWEEKDRGWQKKVVEYGNHALRRIPYEEWGLKSVPPLSTRRRDEEMKGTSKVELVYPKALIPTDKVSGVLEKMGTEGEALHRRRLLWCFVGMPLTLPIALIPLVPNLPFFYLVYRAWSHWRAIAGGKHIQFLLQNRLLTLSPSPILDDVYATQKQPLSSSAGPTTEPDTDGVESVKSRDLPHPEGEAMLLSQANGKKMTQALDLPQLEVELERAIWQVEKAIKKQRGEEDERVPETSLSQKPGDNTTKKDEKKSQ